MYWRNMGKLWQNGVNTSQENGAFRNGQLAIIFNWRTACNSGGKDSCMEGGKKMLCLGIFSTRQKHTENLCLWNSSVFGVCWEYGGCESIFFAPGILLCGVTEATVLPLNYSAEKKQYSGCRNLANPETLCTIFLHPWMGGGDLLAY